MANKRVEMKDVIRMSNVCLVRFQEIKFAKVDGLLIVPLCLTLIANGWMLMVLIMLEDFCSYAIRKCDPLTLGLRGVYSMLFFKKSGCNWDLTNTYGFNDST